MRAALLLALAAFVAGCVQPPEPGPIQPADAVTPSALAVEARDCRQGGGHSTYDKEVFDGYGILPEPWVTADVSEDLGRQTLSSQVFPPVHMSERIVGNYHVSVVCESHLVHGTEGGAFGFGWVAIRVEPPPFDDGTADRHYLTTMFSVTDPALATLFKAAGIHTGAANAVVVEPQGPMLRTLFDDPGHGVYESSIRYEEVGKVPARITRVWLLVGLGGHHGDRDEGGHEEGPYRPVAIDFVDTEASHLQTPVPGSFTHLRTNDHDQALGPVTVPVPGAAAPTAGLAFLGFDRTIRPGPQPDVTLDEMYDHQ